MSAPRPQLSVETLNSLGEVDPDQWDALSPNDALASHGWLRALEEELSEDIETRYILALEGEQLVAAAPCYLYLRKHRLFDPDHLMFGRFERWAHRLGFSFAPALLVGPHHSCGPNLLLSDQLVGDERKRVGQILIVAIEQLAVSRNLSLHFPEIPVSEIEVSHLLQAHSYHRTRDFPVSCLEIEWGSFDGYLSYLRTFSHHMRRNVTKEINRFRDSGIHIDQIEDPAAHADRLLELANSHYSRVAGTSFPYSSRFLTRLKDLLGDDAVFYGAWRDDRLLGFVVMLVRGSSGYLLWTGIDYAQTQNDATYFNLVYYRPIEDAIARGIDRLYYGKTSYEAKGRRGLKTIGIQQFYLSNSKLRQLALAPWFSFHSAWMTRRVQPLEDLERLRRFRGD